MKIGAVLNTFFIKLSLSIYENVHFSFNAAYGMPCQSLVWKWNPQLIQNQAI
jgi:hypothetical protein